MGCRELQERPGLVGLAAIRESRGLAGPVGRAVLQVKVDSQVYLDSREQIPVRQAQVELQERQGLAVHRASRVLQGHPDLVERD